MPQSASFVKLIIFIAFINIGNTVLAKNKVRTYSATSTLNNTEYTYEIQFNDKDVNSHSELIGNTIKVHIACVSTKEQNKKMEEDFYFLVEEVNNIETTEYMTIFECIYVNSHTPRFELPINFPKKLKLYPDVFNGELNVYNSKGEFKLKLKVKD